MHTAEWAEWAEWKAWTCSSLRGLVPSCSREVLPNPSVTSGPKAPLRRGFLFPHSPGGLSSPSLRYPPPRLDDFTHCLLASRGVSGEASENTLDNPTRLLRRLFRIKERRGEPLP